MVWYGAFDLHAQSPRIQQLLESLAEVAPDSHKVDLLNELSWEYHRIDLNECLRYAKLARSAAEQMHYQKGIARSMNLEAITCGFRNDLNAALRLNRQALGIAETIRDSFLITVTNNDIGIDIQNDYPLSLVHLQRALEFCPKNKTLIKVFLLGNIAELHLDLGNKQQADGYIQEISRISQASSDTSVIITGAMTEAVYAKEGGEISKARDHYEKAYSLAARTQDFYSLAEAELGLADLHQRSNELQAALEKISSAEKNMNKSGNQYFLADCLFQKSEISYKLGDWKAAEKSVQQSLEIARKNKDLPLKLKCFHLIKNVLRDRGYPELALAVTDSILMLKDLLSDFEKNQIFAQHEMVFQTEKKEAENRLLKKANEAGRLELRNNRLLLLGSFMIILLGSGIIAAVWRNYRSKDLQGKLLEQKIAEKTSDLKALNEELRASNQELERFTSMASHDLKEPIRNIVSFAGLLKKKLDQAHTDAELKEHAGFIIQNTKHLYTLIEDVLTFTRLGSERSDNKMISLERIVEQVNRELRGSFPQIPYRIETDGLPEIKGSETMLFLIFKNLIENGVKFNQSNPPSIWVNHHLEDGLLHLSFRDNGIGIAPEFHSQVFEMFKRLHTRQEYEGAGIGLATCKKIVLLMNGKINLDSKPGEGSRFTVILPVESSRAAHPLHPTGRGKKIPA